MCLRGYVLSAAFLPHVSSVGHLSNQVSLVYLVGVALIEVRHQDMGLLGILAGEKIGWAQQSIGYQCLKL